MIRLCGHNITINYLIFFYFFIKFKFFLLINLVLFLLFFLNLEI